MINTSLLGNLLIFVAPIIVAIGATWFWFYRE